MNLEGKTTLNAEPARVWDVLMDVDQFAACLPGVEEVTRIDDRTFDGTITASVGPMSGKFSFRAQIVDSNPPHEMVAHVDGTDSVTKSTMKMDVTMGLTQVAPRQTEMAYRSNVDIKGRLAILGDVILRATAALMMDEFTRRLRRQIETPGT